VTIVSVSGVTIQYGASVLLRDVTFAVAAGERWGVIGRNGSGKTSLFRVITGDHVPEQGGVSRIPGLRVALLDQHRDFGGAGTIWEAAASPFRELLELERSLDLQGHALGAAGDRATSAQLAKYDRDLERFSREGGYEIRARVSAVLHGLGFDPDQAHLQPLATLSGGERGRLGLACQLVAPADLLLLDEPTNHLDLDTTAWLTAHLRGLDAAMLLVSHDRAFLDAVADRVLHLEAGTAFSYTGGYSAFVTQRAERRLSQERAYGKQAKMIAEQEDFIRRNIAGQKTKQAKGRRRLLSRLPRLSPPPGEDGAMAVRFRTVARSGDQVLVAEDLRVMVEDRVLLDRFKGVVRRGDVIGLVGPNGTGKSTLLATMLGDRPPAAGRTRIGDATSVAVYRQDLGQVPKDKSLFDIIHDLRPMWTRGQVQDHLGRFDFSGDSVLRRAGSLSGGEQARVALAMMVLADANFLVFDEPTNHLDVESIEALEDAIGDYDGTVLLVSHDRALLENLCTRVWYLEHAHITDYDGSFGAWEQARAERRRAAEAAAREATAQRKAREKRDAAKPSAGKAQQSAERTARRALEQAEARVHQLEATVATLTERLGAPGLYTEADGPARAAALAAELDRCKAELEVAYRAWESAAAEAERLGA
jgi:ATP-binding cassette subfamily F protein 3